MRAVLCALALVAFHKSLLIACMFASPFTWDTSSQLLLRSSSESILVKTLASRVLIWDSVYYITTAYRGLRYEHEYAFSRYWSALVRLLSPKHELGALALTAAAVSLISHAVAVVLLLKLSRRWASPDAAFRAAWLYTLSPAGIFLIAGYPESLFAALSFAGLLLVSTQRYVLAGTLLGAAALLRSNGLFWGIVFLGALFGEIASKQRRLARVLSIIVGGSLIGVGFLYPQAEAYWSLCPGLEWCDWRVPSIYAYVQARYWNNGLFHYWVPANIPNFFLGMPTLALLVLSTPLLWRRKLYGLAVMQLTLAVGAVFFWHVQIITRMASCVPGPYWYVAELLGDASAERKRKGKLWIAYFGLWGVTQAVLFGAFLPPA